MISLSDNLHEVEERIRRACERSGRKREDVTLVAVSKTKPASMVQEAFDLGLRDFGENKPQELRDKFDVLPQEIRWHMIGNLQRNKVKYVVGRAVMIHSVGSLSLAEAIDAQARKLGIVVPCLIEVNAAGEASKGGVSPGDAEALIRSCSTLEGIRIKGLMTIAPFTENAEENRVYFRALRNLAVDIAAKNIDNVSMCELSMGMTGDYEVAVEEGATLIRVGTGIFGARDYRI